MYKAKVKKKIEVLLKKAKSTTSESEKTSCLNLAKKIASKHGLKVVKEEEKKSPFEASRPYEPKKTTYDFSDFVNDFGRYASSIRTFEGFKNMFYTSQNGNRTFYEQYGYDDYIRITIIEMEEDALYNVCCNGYWENNTSYPYQIAYELYKKELEKMR